MFENMLIYTNYDALDLSNVRGAVL